MIDPMSLRTQAGVHEIAEGVTLEWVADGLIFIVVLPNSKPATLDVFRDMHLVMYKNWPKGMGFFELVDLTSANILANAYARETSQILAQEGRAAGMVGNLVFVQAKGSAINSFMYALVNLHNRLYVGDRVQASFVTDRAKGLEALHQQLRRWNEGQSQDE